MCGESIKASVYPHESPSRYQYQAHRPNHPHTSKDFSYSPTHLIQRIYLQGSWIWRSLPPLQQLASSRLLPILLQLPSKIASSEPRSHSLADLRSSPWVSRRTVAFFKSVRSISQLLLRHHNLTVENTDNPLSVDHIKSEGGATCTFNGIDGSVTTVVGAQTVIVAPPQRILSGACRAF